MKNINTAANLAMIILGLPEELQSLPVCSIDCDCGKDLHPVNSLNPYRDQKGNICLIPTVVPHQVDYILSAYKELKKRE